MGVEIVSATKRFGAHAAVDGVSLDAPDGAFVAILGASGCGKTTLLRLVAGLEALDDGEIRIAGATVADARRSAPPEARRVAMVFQSFALWPHMSVRDNVAFPAENAGATRAAARAEADRRLASVGLAAFVDRAPAALSGGQRQRVALARCLASDARAVLMDEPLANLDPHLRGEMEAEIRAFHRALGATTLYITHDQREAMALADQVAVMADGRFLQVGPPEEVYARPASEAVARFVGRGGIAPVRVVEARDGAALVEAAGARFDVGAGTGRSDRVLLRPEHIALDETGPWRATVVEAAYRGGVWEATLAVEGLDAPLQASAATRLRDGETVRIRPTGGWLLPT